MKVVDIFSHRNGLDILESPRFRSTYQEFLGVLKRLSPYRSAKRKKTSSRHVISPGAMNQWLAKELSIKLDWDFHPLIIDADPGDPSRISKLKSDFRKNRVEVEVQFGNVARYAYDVYKMAISMALEKVDVGVMVVCTKRFAAITGGNIAYFERAVRELERSKLTLIVPLAVIGIEPEKWIVSAYPGEEKAPAVTTAMINDARRRRGQTPMPTEDEEEEEEPPLTLKDLKRIAAFVA